MPQLNNLKIQNFRLFENLEIPHLGQINLLVGKNHAGKSTVLEALCIYESLGSPLLLEKLLEKHDELEAMTDGEGFLSKLFYPPSISAKWFRNLPWEY